MPSVTVVIPTLGSAVLDETLRLLNEGSIVPDEILVCIPEAEAPWVRRLHGHPNVRVLVTTARGQVAQRAAGFREATGDYVLQVDDDMLLDHDCVELLMETMTREQDRASVAAPIYCTETGESVFKRRSASTGRFRSVYRWLVTGTTDIVPGTITPSGAMVGIDPAVAGHRVVEVSWVPGGCVLHARRNLVLENYFPFGGKAYYEDLLHSLHLREKQVRLLMDCRARCSTACGGDAPYIGSYRELWQVLRAQHHFVRRASLSHAHFALYAASTLIKFPIRAR